jgi:hypothetical protein
MVTRIEQGKGYENPYVKLSPQALTILRMPARSIGYSPVDQEGPLEPNVLHAACRSARAASKPVTVYALSSATTGDAFRQAHACRVGRGEQRVMGATTAESRSITPSAPLNYPPPGLEQMIAQTMQTVLTQDSRPSGG